MRKKCLLALMALACALSLVFGTITANAALKETTLSPEIVTESGLFNELDWEKVSDNADKVYTENVSDSTYLQWNSNGWADCWLVGWDTVSFDKGDVYVEFDILEWSNSIKPVIGSVVTAPLQTIWVNSAGIIDPSAWNGTAIGDADIDYYADRECTELYADKMGDPGAATHNSPAWFYVTPSGTTSARVRFVFTEEGILGVQRADIQEDGVYEDADFTSSIYLKTAYPTVTADGEYYVGINGHGQMKIDNFKIAYEDGTEVISTDFENADWQETIGTPTSGKILNFKGTMGNDAEFLVTNPDNADRVITLAGIEIDEDVNEAFKLSAEVSLRNLGKPIGFAFGLADADQAIDAAGTSFIYFENKTVPATGTEGEEGYVAAHTETFVNVMKGGVAGTAVSVGKDITGESAAFVPVVLEGYRNGDIKVTVDGKEITTFTGQNIEGKVAIATNGTGEVTAAFGIGLSLVSYSYRGSEGSAVATNFNTGYINPENWASSSVKAVMFANPDEAVGLTVEDGALFFKGTADGTYFASTRAYADYVLEFDYITYHNDDKPELNPTWTHGYSDLSVNLGCQSGHGWGNSIMVLLKQSTNNVQLQNYKGGLSVVEDGEVLSGDTTFVPAAAGQTVTNKVKIVVASNTISVYLITVEEGVEPTSDDFVLAAQFTVPDTYGIVSFGTTESGYFKIDNVRITPIDDKDPAKVQENLEAYKDLQPIPDEYRPVTLEAPVVTLNGNVASWTAVEDATGYIINVNGETTNVGADVLSYTFTQTEPGDYLLTVTAVGNGDYISNSPQSSPVTYTVGGGSGNQGGGEEGGSGCGGCGSSVGGASLILGGLLAAGAVIVLCKKSDKKKN